MKTTIGGQRLGSGNKMTVDLKNFERSTHDLGYTWRSTMAAGTLVPFLVEVALPGDTFEIDLNCIINTHPTIGPLFGSFKVQLDVFQAPIRLYHKALHNNKLGIGNNMAAIKLPQITLPVRNLDLTKNVDNQHVNPSALLSYLNIRGMGRPTGAEYTRDFNALPLISYWDIYKNYYANKQEEIGAYIHTTPNVIKTITKIDHTSFGGPTATIPLQPATDAIIPVVQSSYIIITYSGTTPNLTTIKLKISGTIYNAVDVFDNIVYATGTTIHMSAIKKQFLTQNVQSWRYLEPTEPYTGEPTISTFPLTNLDKMREDILSASATGTFKITDATQAPYGTPLPQYGATYSPLMYSQEGLGLKTYQSDLLNNWLKTEWIVGAGSISELTAVSTVGNKFTIDSLNLAKKVYDMLNRIAISGGTYDDYIETVWGHEGFRRAETPIYHGGLIKELIFEEVINNSASEGEDGKQPLGTLAGKGRMASKHKGGSIHINIDEPSYLMGIISLTPRIDYSQGNKWDVNLKTMDDFHKPNLDQIGFQDNITEQHAWWDTIVDSAVNGAITQYSAGKQPAWINYMTNVNIVRGNFAIEDNEMFMTLNRRFERNTTTHRIKDLTTYIDPVKFNNIFAETKRDAQNFWVQIGVDMIARRKMSAKIMPNL